MSEPDPRAVRTPAEFVALLHVLKEWSGLTYRELTGRAAAVGDVLPRSTVANMLARTTVPREELVAAYARACGCGPSAVEEWLAVRKELAVRGGRVVAEGTVAERTESGPAPVPGPTALTAAGRKSPPTGPDGGIWRRVSRAKVLVPVLVLAAIGATAALVAGDAFRSGSPSDGVPAAPATGERKLRAVHSGLCLAERAGAGSGKVYQAPCEGRIPKYSLVRMGEKDWRIASLHPEFEDGCMGVRWARTGRGDWLEDDVCENRNPAAETFRFEAVGTPVKGYRIRPRHTDMCVTVPGASREQWTALEQHPCTDDAAGQLFRFDPVEP